MSEEKEMEKTVVVRPEAAPEVKEQAGVPMEKAAAMPPAEKPENTLPAERAEAGLPVEQKEEVERTVDSPEADIEINIIDDRDKESDSLIHWAAARAGVIVAAPLLGTAALVANEVYMISKIGSVYGVELNQKAVLSFIGSLGATVVGSTLATLIPLSFMQIPIAISVTYGVGKAAQRWIKDGMPDDTRPYRAVFEEGKKEGEKAEKTLENDPKKDIPLGDEKKDFTKELKDTWDDVYPEKAHEAVEKLAGQLTDSVVQLGEKLTDALKKAGVTDEQIEKAKYTALGASEVAQETAEKTAKDIQAIARIRSREFKKDAARRADEMKAEAKAQMEALQKKAEEMKRQSEIHSQEMKQKSEELKAKAKVQMDEARAQMEKLRAQAEEQAAQAQAKAKEISEKIEKTTKLYKENAAEALKQAQKDLKDTAEEYKEKIEERARQKKAEAEAAKKEGKPVEDPGKPEGTPPASDNKN